MTQPDETSVSEKIALIIGQTDYSADEAELKLKSKKYDEIAVIREYLTSETTTSTSTPSGGAIVDNQKQSKNQLIYSEIRKFMDSCAKIDVGKVDN
jgi:hypothetical protein